MPAPVTVEPASSPRAPPPRDSDAEFGHDYFGRPRFAKFIRHYPEQGTILDFGCFNGVFLHVLRAHGRQGLGVDYDRNAVEGCKEHGLEAVHADIFEFTANPQNHGRYAGVMLADFIEHFDPYPLQTLLRQTVGVLEPGGTIVIITPNSHSIGMNNGRFYEVSIEHHNLYAVAAVAKFLEGEGMETVELGPDPDSRSPVFSWHPLRFLRNLGIHVLGRILCGRNAMYDAAYLVARKVGDPSDRFAERPGDAR